MTAHNRAPRGPVRIPRLRVEPVALAELPAGGSLLQSAFWGRFRERLGWKALAFRWAAAQRVGAAGAAGESFPLLVLVRSLPGGLRLAYVGHGPQLPEPGPLAGGEAEALLLELARALKPHLPRCLFLRFDLPWGLEGEGNLPPPLSEGGGLSRAEMDIQPPSTVILEVDLPDADLLKAMKPKTRYNVGLAEKRGVTVREGSTADLPAWYALYEETARRDRITLHSESYYRALLEMADAAERAGGADAPSFRLLLAEHEGDLLAGIIVALWGQGATYLYGASADRKRNLMASYALQWRAMRLAREQGCRTYDLFGIPPRDDPAHPMHGLYRFKTGFGGTILNRPGCYDAALRPGGYRAYRLAEALRSFYFRRWRKRFGARPGLRGGEREGERPDGSADGATGG